MRKTVHLCLASHGEVMFRDEEDFVYNFNCIAGAALNTESRLLAEGRMTTHQHSEVQSDDWREFAKRYRYPYSRYFNSKYRRKGRLGDRDVFAVELCDVNRITTCASYINRQGLHHGVTSTPFGYPYCSANAVFRKELGKDCQIPQMPDSGRAVFLPRSAEIPSSIRMGLNGQLFPEDVIDVRYVEELYITPRNFLFHMNRFSDEKWVSEQLDACKGESPVTLDSMETGIPDLNITRMLANEKGRVRSDVIQDLDLCKIIDRHYVPRILGCDENVSIYSLPLSKRKDLGNQLFKEIRQGTLSCPQGKNPKTVTLSQLTRCLGLTEE